MSFSFKKYHWFFKYKLYHLPFWFLYHYFWWTIYAGSAWAVVNNILYSPYAIKFLFYVIFQAVGVYFNLYFLIPRFLEPGHYTKYISLVIVTIGVTAALIVPGYYTSSWLSGTSLADLYGTQADSFWYFFKINTLPSSAASTTLAISVKQTKNWIQAKQREQLLQKEKLETELNFLKSQFNPHFLFNTINSIFVLIHKNPDMASESLAKFSELLRYQLYECNEQQIPLSQELAYLENFIELEKLRQDPEIELSVQIDSLGSGNVTIAPFIMIPFVENAFKHVSRLKGQPNRISILAYSEHNNLFLRVINTISLTPVYNDEPVNNKGIGLKNIQRRLDLIYPGKYDLAIKNINNEFTVNLRLSLYENKSVEIMQIA